MKQFLDLTGLTAFFTQLKELFATKEAVNTVEQDTNMYVTDVDYAQVEFDKYEIISYDDGESVSLGEPLAASTSNDIETLVEETKVGTVLEYTGETTDEYEAGRLYLVDEEGE
jgi:hypothetical protein